MTTSLSAKRQSLLYLATSLLPVGFFAASAQATISWNVDSSGTWTVASNWSGGAVPSSSDDVVIDRPAGNFTINLPSGTTETIHSLGCNEGLNASGTLSLATVSQINGTFSLSGTLTGAGDVTLAGSATFQNGSTISGPGNLNVASTASVFVNLLTNGTFTQSGRNIENSGFMNFAEGNWSFSGKVDNLAGGTLNFNPARFFVGTINGGLFNNSGLLQQTGLGTTLMSARVNNSGTVSVTSGTLVLNNGGVHTGTFLAGAASSELIFGGGSHDLTSVAALSDAGITLRGATLVLGSDFTFPPGFSWDSGTITGTGPLVVPSTNTLNISRSVFAGTATIDGRSLYNSGTINWVPGGNDRIFLSNGSINNLAGATFLASAITGGSFSGTGSINNAGTFTKTGSQFILCDVQFNNTGTFNLNQGSVHLNGGGTFGGTFNVTSGTLTFGGFPMSFPGTIFNLNNGGRVEFQNSTTLTTANSVNFGAGTNNSIGCTFGTLTIGSGFTFPSSGVGTLGTGTVASYVANDGTILATDAILTTVGTFTNRQTVSGLINANGAFNNQAIANIGGGSVSYNGAFTGPTSNTGSLNIATASLNIGSLSNQGTVTVSHAAVTLTSPWTNSGTINIANSGLTLSALGTNTGSVSFVQSSLTFQTPFNVAALATFSLSSDSFVSVSTTFQNSGNTLTLDNTTPRWSIASNGTVQGGTLSGLSSKYSVSSGTLDGVVLDVDIAPSSTLTFANGCVLSNHTVQLTSSSTVAKFLGTQTVNGNGTFAFASPSPAQIYATSGSLTFGSGITVLASAGNGTLGTGTTTTVNQGRISAQARSISTVGTFVNQGVMQSSSGSFTFGSLVTNSGTIALDHAIAAGTGSSALVNSGTISVTNGGTFTVTGPLSGNGTIAMDSSVLNLGGSFTSSLGNLQCNGGTVNFTGLIDNTSRTLTLNSNTIWRLRAGTITGGTIGSADAGKLEVLISGSTVGTSALNGVALQADLTLTSDTLNITSPLPFDGRKFDFRGGILNFTGSLSIGGSNTFLFSQNTSTLQTSGTLTLGKDVLIKTNGGNGFIGTSGRTITNQGMISNSSATKGLFLSGTFNNAGTVEAHDGGYVDLQTAFNNTGTIYIGTNCFMLGNTGLSNSGTIDVCGALGIQYAGSSPINSLRSQIVSGYANGAWNGLGFSSSASAANGKLAVGYGEKTTLGIGSFAGHTLSGNAVLIRDTFSGDANLDGTVNSADFTRLAAHFNSPTQFWTDGDFNYDRIVNALDFNALASNFGQSLASPSLGTVVPEPLLTPLVAFALYGLRPLSRRCSIRVAKRRID